LCQTYKLPWPLKPRELLMQCRNQVSHREHTLTASCRSVESKACPITSDAVRMEILESQWTFEALPPGGKMSTKVSVYILINERFAVGIRARPPTAPSAAVCPPSARRVSCARRLPAVCRVPCARRAVCVPCEGPHALPLLLIPRVAAPILRPSFAASWVVKYVQAQSLKDTVHQYHKACLRLSLPPHLDFLGWRRTRQQARAAAAAHASGALRAGAADDEWSSALMLLCALATACAVYVATLALRGGRARFWWATRSAPCALRKVGRAVSRSSTPLKPRVPLSGGGSATADAALPRSCSLTQLDHLANKPKVAGYEGSGSSAEALLSGGLAESPLSCSRRSVSASNLGNVWRLSS
jgi:hypothetical protein